MCISASLRVDLGQTEEHVSDEKAIWQVLDHEQHFNTIQAGIRGLASAWILAACAGASKVLLTTNPGTGALLPLSTIAMDAGVVLLLIFAALFGGLLLLWTLDQLVYHRLLLSTFVAGLRLELVQGDLQPIHWIMCVSDEGKKVPNRLWLFYFAPMLASLLLSLGLTLWMSWNFPFGFAQGLCWVILVLNTVALVWMSAARKEATLEQFAQELRDLGNPDAGVGLPISLNSWYGPHNQLPGEMIRARLGLASATSAAPKPPAEPHAVTK
jgi:hypothetical protein